MDISHSLMILIFSTSRDFFCQNCKLFTSKFSCLLFRLSAFSSHSSDWGDYCFLFCSVPFIGLDKISHSGNIWLERKIIPTHVWNHNTQCRIEIINFSAIKDSSRTLEVQSKVCIRKRQTCAPHMFPKRAEILSCILAWALLLNLFMPVVIRKPKWNWI